jgi:type I restriction enzyme S subunit
MELLREYRTRLISDVVTGKLDVREAAARLPGETDNSERLDDPEAEIDNEESADDSDAIAEEAEA